MYQQTAPSMTTPPTSKRWVGGVAAVLASRTGSPVALIRAGWIGVILLLAYAQLTVLAWIPILTYGACWFTLGRRTQNATYRPPSAGPAPTGWHPTPPATHQQTNAFATTPGAFGPTIDRPAQAPASRPNVPNHGQPMNRAGQAPRPQSAAAYHDNPTAESRPYLRDFVQYLWTRQPTPQPTYSADLTGVVLTGLKFPGSRDPGYYATRMPFGKVYVYPDYLVFLTESHNPPGRVPGMSQIVPVLLDAWRAVGFWRPIRLAQTVYRKVTTEELDQLRKPLGNPNSIIVPVAQICGVSKRRYTLTRYIVIHTTTGDVMLAPNSYLGLLAAVALPFLLLRNVRMNTLGALGMSWETGLLAALEQAARRHSAPGTR